DVVGVETHIHARLVIGRRNQVVEYVEYWVFEIARKTVVAPGLPHQPLRAGPVALQQQCAREREFSLGGRGSFFAEECTHEGRVKAVRPQRRLSATAQQTDRWPTALVRAEPPLPPDLPP